MLWEVLKSETSWVTDNKVLLKCLYSFHFEICDEYINMNTYKNERTRRPPSPPPSRRYPETTAAAPYFKRQKARAKPLEGALSSEPSSVTGKRAECC